MKTRFSKKLFKRTMALRVQLSEKNSKFQSSSESLLKGESRPETLGKEIKELKQQLASKNEEYTLLTSALPKCREHQEKLKVELKNEFAKLLGYLRDLDKARSQHATLEDTLEKIREEYLEFKAKSLF
ncbi:APETALA3-like protein [Sesbania bispinosa]|nr:APETALA3-like protein [Sesbania bispinosa]